MLKTFKNVSVAVGVLSAFALAQNVLNNGDLEYGDGGWYVWNNENDPSDIVQKLGEPEIGVDKSHARGL